MNNSDQINAATRKAKQVRIVIITVVAIVFYVSLALTVVRGTFKIFENTSTSSIPWLKNRVRGIIKYFESANDNDGYKILFLGASDIQLAIDPNEIDIKLGNNGFKTKTFNLGVANFDGQLLFLLARRLHEIYESNKNPIDSIIVKFTPLRATYRYLGKVEDHYYRHFEDVESIIYSDKMLAEDFGQKPEEASEIWYVKNILGESSPISFVSYINQLIWDYIPIINLDQSYNITYKLMNKNWGLGELNFLPAWNIKKRGYHYFGFPENQQTIEELFSEYKKPAIANELLKFHNRTGDLKNLYFSPLALKSYVDAIKELQKITPHVLLLYFPESNLIPREPGAAGRLTKALNQIQYETGVKFLDLTKENSLEPGDYFDFLHLNLSGQKKLSERLATELPHYLNLPKISK